MSRSTAKPPRAPAKREPKERRALGQSSSGVAAGKSDSAEPALWLVSTPIGNLGDMTARAIETLQAASLILAEDTRVARKLMAAFGIDGVVERCDEEATARATAKALARLEAGQSVAFTSDAGTPGISDPGMRLARAVIDAGFPVRPVPGASAVLAALVISGLPTEQFAFAGFVPNKPGARASFLAPLAVLPMTTVMYETGPRLEASLAAMVTAFGAYRPACVARELTKLYEEAWRGPLSDLLTRVQSQGAPRGEIVVVIAPAPEENRTSALDIDALLRKALANASTKEAAQAVASQTGLARTTLYARALELKQLDAG